MRGSLIRWTVAALAAVLLATPAASADTVGSSTGKRAFVVEPSVTYRGNEPTVVRKFKFDDAVVSCSTGPMPNPFTTDSPPPHFGPMPVNNRGRFGRVFSNDGQEFNGKVVIRGKFVTRRKLEGTLKIKGDYPKAGYEDCNSGKLKWAYEPE